MLSLIGPMSSKIVREDPQIKRTNNTQEKVIHSLIDISNNPVLLDAIKTMFSLSSITLMIKYINKSSFKNSLKIILITFISSWTLYFLSKFIFFLRTISKNKKNDKKIKLINIFYLWIDFEYGIKINIQQINKVINMFRNDDDLIINIDIQNAFPDLIKYRDNKLINIIKYSYNTSFLKFFIQEETYTFFLQYIVPIIIVILIFKIKKLTTSGLDSVPWFIANIDEHIKNLIHTIIKVFFKLKK